jgi:cytoskeleton protein RodZ
MSETPAPGLRLKAEREKRGLSALKAANQLHLDPWVIDALESGDYARIGPSVYAKGHLKKYAALLNLSASELLIDFDATQSGAAAQGKVPVGSTVDTPPLHSVSTSQMAGGVVVVAILGALVWWKPWQPRSGAPIGPLPVQSAATQEQAKSEPAFAEPATGDDHPAEPARSPPTVAKNVQAHATPTLANSVQPAPAAAGTGGAALTQTPPVAGSGRARLRLSFTSDSWVDVRDAQGNKAYVGNGSANTVKTISGIAPMHVYLRSASGVQLEINGRAVAIGPQFFAGDAARFDAGADGVLRREAHRDATPPAHPNG